MTKMMSKPSVGSQSVIGMGAGAGWISEVSTLMAKCIKY